MCTEWAYVRRDFLLATTGCFKSINGAFCMKVAVTLSLSAVLLTGCASHCADTEPADDLARQGHKLAEQGRTQAARKLLDQALALDPQHAWASFDRGQLLLSQGELQLALADFDRAVAREPNNPRFLGARCVARAVAAPASAELADCSKALAQHGKPGNGLVARGQAYLALQRNQDALADFEAALTANSANMRALYGRGVARQRLGDSRGVDDQQLAVSRLPGAGREYVVPALR
jgi:tetratricopeptide (TPR) repeat protein